jgi:hypothetical protein
VFLRGHRGVAKLVLGISRGIGVIASCVFGLLNWDQCN